MAPSGVPARANTVRLVLTQGSIIDRRISVVHGQDGVLTRLVSALSISISSRSDYSNHQRPRPLCAACCASERFRPFFFFFCRHLHVIDGPAEAPRPKNVGLLFFTDEPQRFFPATQIDVVWFPDGAGGRCRGYELIRSIASANIT